MIYSPSDILEVCIFTDGTITITTESGGVNAATMSQARDAIKNASLTRKWGKLYDKSDIKEYWTCR